MDDTLQKFLEILAEIKLFLSELSSFVLRNLRISFFKFEHRKGIFATALYRQRGKHARTLMHTGMTGIAAVGMIIAPMIAKEFPGRSVNPWELPETSVVLSATSEDPETDTLVSNKVRDKIIEYTVIEGDTVASIAEKFGVSQDTIRWRNNLVRDRIKVGQTLQVIPVTGIAHKVQKGDTVYSISKKYDSEAQAIVDFPFNSFSNDETFELAIGQTVIVPDGVKPADIPAAPRTRQLTPNAGTVVASGNFVWPTSGQISQGFAWYHKGIDIANRTTPDVLAADAGTVEVAGWPDNYGYGNRVVINHGNGYKTLYGHLAAIYVVPGQTVGRGARIGKMGDTGRSTGTHTHFEVIQNGVHVNPLNVLR